MKPNTAAIIALFVATVILALALRASADVCVDGCVASPVSPVSPIYLPVVYGN